eukprot:3272557-Rhodomonas_salina.1
MHQFSEAAPPRPSPRGEPACSLAFFVALLSICVKGDPRGQNRRRKERSSPQTAPGLVSTAKLKTIRPQTRFESRLANGAFAFRVHVAGPPQAGSGGVWCACERNAGCGYLLAGT